MTYLLGEVNESWDFFHQLHPLLYHHHFSVLFWCVITSSLLTFRVHSHLSFSFHMLMSFRVMFVMFACTLTHSLFDVFLDFSLLLLLLSTIEVKVNFGVADDRLALCQIWLASGFLL